MNEQHHSNESQPQQMPTPAAPPTVRGRLMRPPKKAVWPTVIGIIGVIFAIGGILILAMQTGFSFFFEQVQDLIPANAGPNPMEITMQWMPTLAILGLVGALVAVLLLVGSIGLLRRRAWSWMVLMSWAVAKLAVVGVNAYVGFLMGQDMMAQVARSAPQNAPMPMGNGFLWVSLVFNLIIYGAFPVFLLIWLNLADSRREIQRWRSAAQA